MATSIIPRSELRKSGTGNIIVGFAELPVIRKNGQTGWAIPGGGGEQIIFDKAQALLFAQHLDQIIRKNVDKTGRTLQ